MTSHPTTPAAPRCIGIDLGAKHSRIALFDDHDGGSRKVRILQNHNCESYINSYISLPVNSEERLVGDGMHNTEINRVIYDACCDHNFGSSTSTPSLISGPSFARYGRGDGSYCISNTGQALSKRIRQQEAIADILGHLRELAEEDQLSNKTRSSCTNSVGVGETQQLSSSTSTTNTTVIAIPAFSSDNYRRLVAQGAKIAGFLPSSTRIISQSTAVMLAYMRECTREQPTLHPPPNGGLLALVNMGARSVELSVYSMRAAGGVEALQWSQGSAELGGDTFTEALMKAVLSEFHQSKKSSSAISNSNYYSAAWLNSVWLACEKAKESLSSMKRTSICIKVPQQPSSSFSSHLPQQQQSSSSPSSISIQLERAQFQQICSTVYQRLEGLVKAAFSQFEEITQVVMAGDGTRLWQLDELVRRYIPRGDNLEIIRNSSILVPGEVAVQGAALKAAVLAKCGSEVVARADVADFAYSSLRITFHTGGMLTVGNPTELLPNAGGIPIPKWRIPTRLTKGRYCLMQGCNADGAHIDDGKEKCIAELEVKHPTIDLHIGIDASSRAIYIHQLNDPCHYGLTLDRAANLMSKQAMDEACQRSEERRKARQEEKRASEQRRIRPKHRPNMAERRIARSKSKLGSTSCLASNHITPSDTLNEEPSNRNPVLPANDARVTTGTGPKNGRGKKDKSAGIRNDRATCPNSLNALNDGTISRVGKATVLAPPSSNKTAAGGGHKLEGDISISSLPKAPASNTVVESNREGSQKIEKRCDEISPPEDPHSEGKSPVSVAPGHHNSQPLAGATSKQLGIVTDGWDLIDLEKGEKRSILPTLQVSNQASAPAGQEVGSMEAARTSVKQENNINCNGNSTKINGSKWSIPLVSKLTSKFKTPTSLSVQKQMEIWDPARKKKKIDWLKEELRLETGSLKKYISNFFNPNPIHNCVMRFYSMAKAIQNSSQATSSDMEDLSNEAHRLILLHTIHKSMGEIAEELKAWGAYYRQDAYELRNMLIVFEPHSGINMQSRAELKQAMISFIRRVGTWVASDLKEATDVHSHNLRRLLDVRKYQ